MLQMFSLFAFCFLIVQTVLAIPVQPQVQDHVAGGEEHIVIIDKSHPTPPAIEELLSRLALNTSHPDVRWVYNNSAFTGFSASMKSHCLDLLSNMTDVSTIEKAVSVSRADSTAGSVNTRGGGPWGLQSISSLSTFSGDSSVLNYTYSYTGSNPGSGADVYILDTGIYTQHFAFGGRASLIWSYNPSDLSDHDGHGTHVSGTAAGDVFGVASNANIFGIKALDGDGSGWSSNVLAGIDYVINHHDSRKASMGSGFVGSVLSMSLASSGTISSIDSAITQAVEAGVHVCVAAGNTATDACQNSPARSGGTNGPAITVGAVDMTNARASFSNYGTCVDVYAPGVNVISAWIGQPNMINKLDGTSMATPHVTGIVAYLMARYPSLASSPALMKQWINQNAIVLSDGTRRVNNGQRG